MKKLRDLHERIPFRLLSKKTFRIVKLTFILSIVTILQVFATESYSQSTKLTLKLEDVKISDALKEIENQSEFFFLYSPKLIDVERKVNIDAEDETIKDILSNLFEKKVKFAVYDRQVILTPNENSDILSAFQQKRITGTITDKDGAPLPGVNVVVTGTNLGTITDISGKYSIEVSAGAQSLSFSFIGMEPQEISIGTLTQINVTLTESATGLGEVVVIGYGTAKRSEITGSISYVSTKDLIGQPHLNAMDNLRGKVAGVNIFSDSGTPAGNNIAVIRGVGTINSSWEPLYVVDGIQMTSIQYLNPTDIESIEVLKDASAAAIYGARGANGVILITTQRGGKKDGINVEFTSQFNIGKLIPIKNPMYRPMNSKEFMEVQRISYENAPYFNDYPAGQKPELILNNPLLFDSQGNPLYDTDWSKETTRTAFSHSQQLNILSGSENSSAGLFLNYASRQGIFLNSYSNEANIRFVYDAKLSKWFSIGTNMRITPINENDPEIMMGAARGIFQFEPIFPVKWPDGTWANNTQTAGTSLAEAGMNNPVGRLLEEKQLKYRTQLFGNFHVDVNFTPNLVLRSQVGINRELYKYDYYLPKSISLGAADGNASITDSQTTFWQNENYLTYSKNIGDHDVKVMLGASWQQQIYQSTYLSVSKFDNDYLQYYNLGAAVHYNHPTSDYYDWEMNSYFSRVSYTYKGKYSFTGTGRVDGSSRFGKNNKYGVFPSGGISWLVSKENFMSEIKSINLLRLRASYGITGNTEIGQYKSQATINSSTILIGGALQPSSTIARMANPDVKWEKTSQFNIGLDIAVLNNRISFEGDYYYKKTYDLLLDCPIPETSGFTTVFNNIGEVSNKGVDIMITTRNITSTKFDWTTALSFNYNKNRVDKLGENNEDIFPGPNWVDGSQTILRVGKPLGSFWGRIQYGVWGIDQAEEAAKVGQLPGEKHWSTDSQIIGKGYPDVMGSFINRINLGKFDLMVDLQFSLGADILQEFDVITEERNGLNNGIKNQLYNAWTPDNQNTMVQMIRNVNLSGQEFHPSSYWVCDGSYLRGNLLSVGYTLGQGFLNALHLSYLRINASVQNAFIIDSPNLKGYDPESMGFYDKFGQNIFEMQYPKPRTYSFGLTARF